MAQPSLRLLTLRERYRTRHSDGASLPASATLHTNSSLVSRQAAILPASQLQTGLRRSEALRCCAAGANHFLVSLGPGSSTRRRQVSQAAIDQITTMFPNVSQHAARWELERNGGNVERAVERALREGGLPEVRLPFFLLRSVDFCRSGCPLVTCSCM